VNEAYGELGEAAWAWVLGQVRGDEGPWLPEVVSGDGSPAGPGADRDSVYAGIGGLAPVLAEISQYRALTGAEQALAAGIVARLGAVVPGRAEPSLYDGLGGDGFIVPHTLPYSTRDVEPVTYNWCHGPAGTSQLFAALALAGVDKIDGMPVTWLRQRCLDAILASGVPARLRPGFWDNDGRCCGTAGVGDVLLDAAQDCGDPARAGRLLQEACTMADALAGRAIRDQAGARWRFTEHRQDPPLLPPGTSWMQGAAGIATFLLRLARVLGTGLTAPVVDRPDQWWAVPARLRTVHTGSQIPPGQA